ncbi:MAG: hypothetical protein ACRET1_04415 [Burkholderiales bacterium]
MSDDDLKQAANEEKKEEQCSRLTDSIEVLNIGADRGFELCAGVGR